VTEWQKAYDRLYSKVNISGKNDCWIFEGSTISNGYGNMSKTTVYGITIAHPYSHRLAWALANNRWPSRAEVVRHSCDNPPCCNPEHLLIGTQKDNMRDRGKSARWFGTGVGKLSPEQVAYIRGSDKTQIILARELLVDQTTISRVRSGAVYDDNGVSRIRAPRTKYRVEEIQQHKNDGLRLCEVAKVHNTTAKAMSNWLRYRGMRYSEM